MKILALDTSSNACSVALLEGSVQDFSCIERFEIAPRQHTQLILPMIEAVLQEADYDINNIDVLAFGRGPGAFTGVRVATGVVQAISYGADLPVAAVSSLAALAQGFNKTLYSKAQQANKVLVANDARMDEIYFAAYEISQGFMTLRGKECVIKPQQLHTTLAELALDKSWQLTGNGWLVYKEQLQSVSEQCAPLLYSEESGSQESMSRLSFPEAKHIAFLAFKEIADNSLLKAEQVRPVYLRNNVAKKAKKTVF